MQEDPESSASQQQHCTLEIPADSLTSLSLFSIGGGGDEEASVAATLRWRECRVQVPALPPGTAAYALPPADSAVSFMFMDDISAKRTMLAVASLRGIRLRQQARADAQACAAAPVQTGLVPRQARRTQQRMLHAVRSRNTVLEALSVLKRACAGGLLQSLQAALADPEPWLAVQLWGAEANAAFNERSETLHGRSLADCLACKLVDLLPVCWDGPLHKAE